MDQLLGQIKLFAFSYAPQGWAFCDGRSLSIETNAALYSLIGNNFGGNLGTMTFALPDLRGQEPGPNTHYCIALEGIYPSRD